MTGFCIAGLFFLCDGKKVVDRILSINQSIKKNPLEYDQVQISF